MSDENTEEVTESPSDLEVASGHLQPLIDRDASEEEMVVELIQNGFKFARAGRIMNQVLQSLGLRMSAKDRSSAVSELLVAWEFAPENWSQVEECATSISEEVDSTSKAQALTAIRKFAKENAIKLPAKPKGAGGGTRSSKDDAFHSWILQNRDATSADISDYVDGIGVTEKQAPKYVNAFVMRIEFARVFANS